MRYAHLLTSQSKCPSNSYMFGVIVERFIVRLYVNQLKETFNFINHLDQTAPQFWWFKYDLPSFMWTEPHQLMFSSSLQREGSPHHITGAQFTGGSLWKQLHWTNNTITSNMTAHFLIYQYWTQNPQKKSSQSEHKVQAIITHLLSDLMKPR